MLSFYKMTVESLNPEQRKAIEKIYGPVFVLAGPGTGKTHMLTARIAHILASDAGAEAQNIVCLTFTDSAASEMRDRLQKYIGSDAYSIKISTFHGFCQWIMDTYPSIFQEKVRGKSVSDDLQKALCYQKVIQSKKWEHFSSPWDEMFARRDVLGTISHLKRENISSESLKKLIPEEQKILESDPRNFYIRKFKEFQPGDWKPAKKLEIERKIAKLLELADLWESYEKKLNEAGWFDFDDQINWVVQELTTNETLRLDLQERFQWVLVDEYQDTNTAQNTIIWSLTEGIEDPNVMVVGDDDQSIYRFQGASVANIHEFKQRFPKRLEVVLTKNYRSTQSVLDAAYKSVQKNTERADPKKQLQAFKKEKGVLCKSSFGSQYSEINFIVQKSQEFLSQGIPASEIAILVRKNSEIEELARELPKFGIPVSAQISQNIFENEAVKILISMINLFANPKNDEVFFDLLHGEFLGILPENILKLSLLRRRSKQSFIELFLSKKETFSEKMNEFFEFFIQSQVKFWHLRPPVLAEKLLYESGLAEFLTKNNRLSDWQNVRKFIDWVREQSQEKISEILRFIDLHISLGISIRPDPLPADKRSIQIMTAHKSKGLEFEIVFIPGLENKKWGNPRKKSFIPLPHVLTKESFDENEEERRLFFVALTRAKSDIIMSYSKTDFSGKSKNPSPFWHEIPENIMTDISSDETEEEAQKLLPVFLSHQEKTFTQGERDILEQKVKNFVWSASSLQNYLDCPRRFLYQNLYKFPRRPLPQLALGVSLHQALELFFKEKSKTYLSKKTISEEQSKLFLIQKYEYALKGQNLEEKDFKKWLEHGKEVLEFYFDKNLKNFSQNHPYGYELEYNFSKYSPRIDGISITGIVDKIIFLDESKKKVKLVDYKSGKPKPIKEGDRLWRQLVFYDLLVHYSPKNSWEIESCELDFLTSEKGTLGVRRYQVTELDRQKVIEELKQADKSIKSFEFPVILNVSGNKDIEFWNNFGK